MYIQHGSKIGSSLGHCSAARLLKHVLYARRPRARRRRGSQGLLPLTDDGVWVLNRGIFCLRDLLCAASASILEIEVDILKRDRLLTFPQQASPSRRHPCLYWHTRLLSHMLVHSCIPTGAIKLEPLRVKKQHSLQHSTNGMTLHHVNINPNLLCWNALLHAK